MRTLLHEPLLHFVGLGLLLFAWFEWRGSGSGSSRIVITPGQLEHLASGFARTWQRPPTEAELDALVNDHVREEIATREAVANGLDRDDTIIRRRLRQKLEFLVEDAAEQAPPTDAELRRWMDEHPDAFRTEPQVTFEQVFVSAARRGRRARDDAERILARLHAAGPASGAARLGDPSALPTELRLAPLREVSLTFGEGFARILETVPAGGWAGPIESAYGLHLVRVRELVAAGPPDLAAVRSRVEREVVTERRRRALDEVYRRLLARYDVRIERGAAAPVAAEQAQGAR